MIYQGVMITNLSGKLNGKVAAHNRGGPYFRAMFTGVQPDPTPEQQVIRDAFAQAIGLWRTGPTSTQRAAWAAYSKRHPRPNRIGVARSAGALPEFTRANTPRYQAVGALAVVLDPVLDAPLAGTATEPAPGVSLSGAVLTVAWAADSVWNTETGAALLAYTSEQQPLTINFYKTPFTIRHAFLGNTGTPLASPQTLTLPFTPTADQRIFVRLRVTRADGSLSMPYTYTVDGNP